MRSVALEKNVSVPDIQVSQSHDSQKAKKDIP